MSPLIALRVLLPFAAVFLSAIVSVPAAWRLLREREMRQRRGLRELLRRLRRLLWKRRLRQWRDVSRLLRLLVLR